MCGTFLAMPEITAMREETVKRKELTWAAGESNDDPELENKTSDEESKGELGVSGRKTLDGRDEGERHQTEGDGQLNNLNSEQLI